MSHEFWYLSRAAGFTAYALLAVSVLGGTMLATRPRIRVAPPPVLAELHKSVSLLALAMATLHAVLLLGDSYIDFRMDDVLVPFASPYRPLAVGLGVLALYGLVVLVASFYLRPRIGYRAWRTIHYLSFAVFGGATLHGILSGTDADTSWFQWSLIVAALAMLLLLANRSVRAGQAAPLSHFARLAMGGALAAIVLGFVGSAMFTSPQPSPDGALARNQHPVVTTDLPATLDDGDEDGERHRERDDDEWEEHEEDEDD